MWETVKWIFSGVLALLAVLILIGAGAAAASLLVGFTVLIFLVIAVVGIAAVIKEHWDSKQGTHTKEDL